jgi:hypothetical protein
MKTINKKLIVFFVLIFISVSLFGQSGLGPLGQSMGEFGKSMQQLSITLAQKDKPSGPILSNFDFAFPPFTDEEKVFVFQNGFFCTNYNDFYISGSKVKDLDFYETIGFKDYVQKTKEYKKRDLGWTIATGITGIGLIAGVLWEATSQDNQELLSPFGILMIGTGVGFTISFTGGMINYANRPKAPPFDAVANIVNQQNRKILKMGREQ